MDTKGMRFSKIYQISVFFYHFGFFIHFFGVLIFQNDFILFFFFFFFFQGMFASYTMWLMNFINFYKRNVCICSISLKLFLLYRELMKRLFPFFRSEWNCANVKNVWLVSIENEKLLICLFV